MKRIGAASIWQSEAPSRLLQTLPWTTAPQIALRRKATTAAPDYDRMADVKRDLETGAEGKWLLKDLRRTCATYYDEHMPESSVEIPGH